jgi:ElaB/YqjD/DUF883 family membrane-anchored ribosome-binding protein
MPTDSIAHATEQIRSEIANGVEKLKDLSGTLKENFETAQKEIRRGVQRGRVAVEQTVDDTRRTIKTRPFAAVAVSAAGGLAIGLAIGLLIGNRRR